MSDPTKLNAANVDRVFRACLFDGEATEEKAAIAVRAQGVMLNVGFDPVHLAAHEGEIHTFIDQLAEVFDDGMSFLQLCLDAQGELWTGVHHTCDQLLVLGIAIGRLAYCLPRNSWSMLPGGLPYIQRKPAEHR